MSGKIDEVYRLFTLVVVVSIMSLTVLAVAYWYIMKQDSTVLTTVSASIGAMVGYCLKALRERISRSG